MTLPAAPMRTLCGIDLVDFDHLEDVMSRHEGFEQRVFTEEERSWCRARGKPTQHFAARFAAKEALLKALGMGASATAIDRTWQDIEVERTEGPPTLVLRGKVRRRADALGAHGICVSLSHGNRQAVAVVTALAPEEVA